MGTENCYVEPKWYDYLFLLPFLLGMITLIIDLSLEYKVITIQVIFFVGMLLILYAILALGLNTLRVTEEHEFSIHPILRVYTVTLLVSFSMIYLEPFNKYKLSIIFITVLIGLQLIYLFFKCVYVLYKRASS
ncbi:hypothetical protein IV471_11370 [Enterococcus gallinarum]|uniref:hypothetical protein n=1 Tax=Enterococcus gallinarum TaxID=1353 RepID=UPI001E5F832A|nr:hypothetical protein [Enterococcus gallinarum]MCD5185882.1 hypothetical protein [Enterococcus gallinarum]